MGNSHIPFKKFLPGIAWFFMLSVLVFLPGNDVPKVKWLDFPNFDKLVHAGLFGGLTFLFCWPFFNTTLPLKKKINYFLFISFMGIFWGISVEFIQKYYVPGRSFDLLDWAADSIGVAIAFFVSKRWVNRLHQS
jgi:VanZ family protein